MKHLLTLFLSALSLTASAWGQKGHDVVCYIAQNHLSDAARSATLDLFEGRSLVYWANWLDNASHTDEYAFSKTWHYKNVDAGQRYEDVAPYPTGDVVTALAEKTAVLYDYIQAGKKGEKSQFSREEAVFALKCVVHLVGDLHQPMHMGHATDSGGNRWTVTFFNSKNNLHSIWDSSILESGHKWSHTEWAEEIDRDCSADCSPSNLCIRCRTLAAGTFDDWARQTATIANDIYLATPENAKLSYDYVAQWTPIIEDQLLRAGIRLAFVLNLLAE